MTGIVASITAVWSEVMSWIITSVQSVVDVFYIAETGLTFMGVLAVVSLGISLFFLIMGLIQNFLSLRS